MSDMKTCVDCGMEEEAALFCKNTNQCKVCRSKYNKEYASKNAVKIKKQKKNAYEDNKETILQDRKEYYAQNKDQVLANVKKYRTENGEQIKELKKEYYETNKDDIKRKANIYDRVRMKSDPTYKLRKYTSRTIGAALKFNGSSKRGQSVMKYLPYSIEVLKEHLEKQFNPWMTWDNRGSFVKDKYDEEDQSTWTWHLDHIIPQASLPYTSMEDDNFKKCWALKNLRPLKSIDNIKKGNRRMK